MPRLVFALLALSFVSAAMAAPKADLWPRWQAHNANSAATIDHSAYNAFLQKYVVVHKHGPNGVKYGQVSNADKRQLERYIDTMENVHIDAYNRRVQRAYWINLYNAETLDLVLKNYPVDSIKDIDGGFFNHGPWDKNLLKVEGEKLSLNDIEHRILRPIWHDTLTHYGVNCASISCPSLDNKAYTGATVDDTLRANAAKYINSPQGVKINGDQVTVSKIYEWYAADFGGSQQAVVNYLRRFADPRLSARLDALQRIGGYDYDWTLNSEANVAKAEQQ